MSKTISFEPLVSSEQAAKILNVSQSWLAKSRMTGGGPDFVRIGRAIRYSIPSLGRFVDARTRSSTDAIGKHDGTNSSPQESED